MQPDFEPVFERKFHSYINCIEGVMHTGQRDMIPGSYQQGRISGRFSCKTHW